MSKRRKYTTEQKIALLKRHIAGGVAVSDLCEEAGIPPSVFYGWQKKLLKNAARALEVPRGRPPVRREKKLAAKVEALEAKLAAKNEVIAEISEEYVRAKKQLGEP